MVFPPLAGPRRPWMPCAIIHRGCVGPKLVTGAGKAVGNDWAGRMGADRIIPAASLDTVDGSGTLASQTGAVDRRASIGCGAFGSVVTYRYHGAAVAVKELKAGADGASIGKRPGDSVVWCAFWCARVGDV